MNRAFDYNGVQVAPSKPVQKLVKRSRILHIDSEDRDIAQYPNNGSFTLYLPRVYERVTSINIKEAEFPAVSVAKVWDLTVHGGTRQAQPAHYPGSMLSNVTDFISSTSTTPNYFFLEFQGLNMSDETAPAADRSASTNSVFAKFVSGVQAEPVLYNESSNAHQVIEFFPALTKLDRFQIRVRTHKMSLYQSLYWDAVNWSISLEIETLENAFDEFSSIETRIGDRA